MMWLLLIIGAVGVLALLAVLCSRSAASAQAAMERAVEADVVRIGRAGLAAEHEINRLVHVAFDEMLDQVERSRREASA